MRPSFQACLSCQIFLGILKNLFDTIQPVFRNSQLRAAATLVSWECLTVVDHKKLDTHKIFLMTDTSNTATGAVLSFGTSWETAHPIAFNSKALKDAELNYPVQQHEKELLAILHGIRK